MTKGAKQRVLQLRHVKELVRDHGKEGTADFNQGVGTTPGQKGRTARAAFELADTDGDDLLTWPEWETVCTEHTPWKDDLTLSTDAYSPS